MTSFGSEWGRTTAVAGDVFPSVDGVARPGCVGCQAGGFVAREGWGAADVTDNRINPRRTTMAVVTMRQLLESGVHFGHQTRRWNPKMKRFIMTERNGIYIIDLQQSVSYINNAFEFVKETVAHGGTVLFVGTKKQAQEPIAEQATRVGMPYVNHRWLGGMLTNFQTISKRLTRLKELEEIDFADVAGSGRTKKELLILQRERDKLDKTLGGIRSMSRVPSAVWIVDTKKEHLAVDEARKLGLPVIAILDTNCDPDEVDYKIPGNDDAIRSVTLLTRVIADAVAEGVIARAGGAAESSDQTPVADEPLPEWERELLAGDAEESASTDTAAAEADAEPSAAAAAAVEADAEPSAAAAVEVDAEPSAAAVEVDAEPSAAAAVEVDAEPTAAAVEVDAEPTAAAAEAPDVESTDDQPAADESVAPA
jgi:small subunit ribosomal protein S2